MKVEFLPREIVVVGWYDGLTEGFVQGLRIFGLVAANILTVSEVRELCVASDSSDTTAETWGRIRARISKFLRTVEGEAELRLCDQLDGQTKDSRRIDATTIIGDLGCDIEGASDSTRFASWMSKFRVDD